MVKIPHVRGVTICYQKSDVRGGERERERERERVCERHREGEEGIEGLREVASHV